MSYDLYLKNPDGSVAVLRERNMAKGGTYAVGGTDAAEFNITYNYGRFYRDLWPEEGIRALYGKTGAESAPMLAEGICKLGTDTDPDYWVATEGNARAALKVLLDMALQCPSAVWDGD